MSDLFLLSTSMTFDMRKYRIRVFKEALHQIGNPSYIQLLVNPKAMVVAIRATTQTDDQAHKVSKELMASDNSVEIYSRLFIEKLSEMIGGLDPGFTYRITGTVLPSKQAAVFPLQTIKKADY